MALPPEELERLLSRTFPYKPFDADFSGRDKWQGDGSGFTDPKKHDRDPQEALRPLIAVADAIAGIKQRTGRSAPTVIT